MTTISQLLKVKGPGCLSVGPGENVYSAVKIMAEEDVGSVLVMGRGNARRHLDRT